MDIVTKIAPLALALIMLGLGLGLGVNDFKRVLQNPKIFFIGICILTYLSLYNFLNIKYKLTSKKK